jgi:hypothetical protein
VWQKSILDGMLGALSTVPAAVLMLTPKIELYNSNTIPKPTSVHGDFTLTTFSGYAAKAVTLTPPGNLTNLDQCVTSTASFTATTGTPFVSDVVTGYMVTDGTATVYAAELFASPVPIAQPGDFLDLDLILPLLVMPQFQV